MTEAFKKKWDRETISVKADVDRAAHRAVPMMNEEEVLPAETAYTKIAAKQTSSAVENEHVFQPQTKVGGAFYLPIKASPEEVYQAVVDSWEALNLSDYSATKEEMEAHGFMYIDGKYMLARTKLTKLDEDPEVYLEINKLEGDGFLFADNFKQPFTAPLLEADLVEDVPQFEPLPAEQDVDDGIQFLEFGADQQSAMGVMQQLLGYLKPRAGVAYDAKKILEAVSILGHNAETEGNMAFFADFADHIVSSTLEILRHEDLTFMPTVYYGSKLVNSFLQYEDLDKDLFEWSTFVSLVDALKKNCLGGALESVEEGPSTKQVMQSRQSKTIIMDSLKRLSAMLGEKELTDDLREKILNDLDEETGTEISALLP